MEKSSTGGAAKGIGRLVYACSAVNDGPAMQVARARFAVLIATKVAIGLCLFCRCEMKRLQATRLFRSTQFECTPLLILCGNARRQIGPFDRSLASRMANSDVPLFSSIKKVTR